jgi:hypothetical protein
MVLRLKTRESRSLPGLLKARNIPDTVPVKTRCGQTTSSHRPAGSTETTGRPQAAFLLRYDPVNNKHRRQVLGLAQMARGGAAPAEPQKAKPSRTGKQKNRAATVARFEWRGVEQPGSSSGS